MSGLNGWSSALNSGLQVVINLRARVHPLVFWKINAGVMMFLSPRCPMLVNGTLLCSWLSIVISQFPAPIVGGRKLVTIQE